MKRRFAPGSLRFRILLAITLWVLLGIGAIWWSATSIFRTHVEMSYHEELAVHVRELGSLASVDRNGQLVLSRPLSDPRYEVPLSGFYWQISGPGLRTVRSQSMTRGSLDDRIAHSPRILHTLENGPSGPAITYGFTRKGPDGQDIHFIIATDQRELDRVIGGFTRDLTVWLVVLASLLLATGFAVTRFGLYPLDRLAENFARLRRGEAQELGGRYPVEIAPLANDLNEYIRQNNAMIARSRVQAGNIAHSLRTPLAIIIDEAERLARRPAGGRAAATLLEQAEAMTRQIEYQLARARSSSGQTYSARSAQVPQVAVPIIRAMERLHPEKQFELTAVGCDGLTLPVDAVDYSEILSILLDNAGKWARSEVLLAFARSQDGSVAAAISDDGPGMAEQDIKRAFEVGARFDTTKPGSGLGLAIARDLCETLGCELTITNSHNGFVATVKSTPIRTDQM